MTETKRQLERRAARNAMLEQLAKRAEAGGIANPIEWAKERYAERRAKDEELAACGPRRAVCHAGDRGALLECGHEVHWLPGEWTRRYCQWCHDECRHQRDVCAWPGCENPSTVSSKAIRLWDCAEHGGIVRSRMRSRR